MLLKMVKSLLLMGSGAGVGASEKKPGAGQKRTGSARLLVSTEMTTTGTCLVVGQERGQGQTRPQLTALSTFTWSRESENK